MWWMVAVFIGSLVLAFAFMPKPQAQQGPGASQVSAPTAEVGRELGVLFGTRDIEGGNWVWYGDTRTVPIKAKGGKK